MIGDRDLIRVSAPVRVDFAGGWTDVAPFATDVGGVVVNAAIALRTTVELRPTSDRYHVASSSADEEEFADSPGAFIRNSRLELIKAAVRLFDIGPCSVRVDAAAPPGSGLGTSGALGVALVHAFGIAKGRQQSPAGIADEAWRMETVDAAVAGGKQDQCAAAHGGVHCFRFGRHGTDARRVAMPSDFAEHLAAHLVLCHTGTSRVSGATITRVMGAYERCDPTVTDALRRIGAVAESMVEALESADLSTIAKLLLENWHHQQRLDASMSTPTMRTLEGAMHEAGALGWKAAGSGAGGAMLFLVPGNVQHAIEAAVACGAEVLPLRWDARGVTEE